MWDRRGNVLGAMKTSALLAFAILAFLTGCGPKDTSAPTAAATAGPREIDITAGDTMKFSVTSIEASPGEDLDVVLTNVGTIPVESVALILGVHRLMSQALTPTNLIGNGVATLVIGRWERALDDTQLAEALGGKGPND